jgi:hypothetical protein
VPVDTLSDSDSESDARRKNVTSECETGFEGNDDSANTSNAGTTTWEK